MNDNARVSRNIATQQPRRLDTLLVFYVGEVRLGIDVRVVHEVTRPVPLSVPLSSAAGIIGMMTLRGAPVAVIDLGVVIGVADQPSDQRARYIAVDHRGSTLCLLVDRVEGLLDVTEASLEPPPSILQGTADSWIKGVTRSSQGDLVGVIDLDTLLSRLAVTAAEACTAHA